MSNRKPIPPSQEVLNKVNNLWDIDPIEGEVISKVTGCEVGFESEGRVFITLNITNTPKKVIKKLKRAHLVWWKATGEWPKQEIDHENRDSTDDRFDNLRECTSRENSINVDRCDRELPTGVYRHSYGNKFYSTVFILGKQKYLGLYDTVEKAAEARNRAILEMHNVNPGY